MEIFIWILLVQVGLPLIYAKGDVEFKNIDEIQGFLDDYNETTDASRNDFVNSTSLYERSLINHTASMRINIKELKADKVKLKSERLMFRESKSRKEIKVKVTGGIVQVSTKMQEQYTSWNCGGKAQCSGFFFSGISLNYKGFKAPKGMMFASDIISAAFMTPNAPFEVAQIENLSELISIDIDGMGDKIKNTSKCGAYEKGKSQWNLDTCNTTFLPGKGSKCACASYNFIAVFSLSTWKDVENDTNSDRNKNSTDSENKKKDETKDSNKSNEKGNGTDSSGNNNTMTSSPPGEKTTSSVDQGTNSGKKNGSSSHNENDGSKNNTSDSNGNENGGSENKEDDGSKDNKNGESENNTDDSNDKENGGSENNTGDSDDKENDGSENNTGDSNDNKNGGSENKEGDGSNDNENGESENNTGDSNENENDGSKNKEGDGSNENENEGSENDEDDDENDEDDDSENGSENNSNGGSNNNSKGNSNNESNNGSNENSNEGSEDGSDNGSDSNEDKTSYEVSREEPKENEVRIPFKISYEDADFDALLKNSFSDDPQEMRDFFHKKVCGKTEGGFTKGCKVYKVEKGSIIVYADQVCDKKDEKKHKDHITSNNKFQFSIDGKTYDSQTAVGDQNDNFDDNNNNGGNGSSNSSNDDDDEDNDHVTVAIVVCVILILGIIAIIIICVLTCKKHKEKIGPKDDYEQ